MKGYGEPIFKYPKYSNTRIFENSLASDLVFVEAGTTNKNGAEPGAETGTKAGAGAKTKVEAGVGVGTEYGAGA